MSSKKLENPWYISVIVSVSSNITLILIALMAGFFNSSNSQKNIESQTEVAVISQYNSMLSQISNMQGKINKFEKDRMAAQDAASAFFQHMPFPAWLKVFDEEKKDFIMYSINEAYEDQWNISKHQYEGRTDTDIWGELVALEYNKNDLSVIHSRRAMLTHELVPNDPWLLDSTYKFWLIAKFPVIFDGNYHNAVGGMAIPEKIKEEIIKDN